MIIQGANASHARPCARRRTGQDREMRPILAVITLD
jgi:hypothetical protein